MATARVPKIQERDERIPIGKSLIGYKEAVESMTADEAFRATVYAMNTLLIQKGCYSAEEFQFQFRQSAQKQLKKRSGH
ncbi:MAG TPA: hypothetical protein VES66_04640 [Terriglobales bacterium]|nr:hypothetical protein [Terriglobales bacterium]